jgi:hypothetical protein
MAREWEDRERGVLSAGCPLHCRLRQDAAGAADQVNWAGLPINLDFAFSQAQRDKVYAQHLRRRRGAESLRWLHDHAQVCVCELAAEYERVGPDAARPMSFH